MAREYQICTRCVMDTTDSAIVFDEQGHCDHCSTYERDLVPAWEKQRQPGELEKLAEKIRLAGKGREYDCILGLSGGIDSSYLALLAKEKMGLRPLVYVVDTGWNLNVAVENIERIVKGLDLDMVTDVVNWNEMRDLQLAFFKAQVPYQDTPQDHAIFSSLYNYAVKHHIPYVLSGSNNATESIRPPYEWVYINDLTFIKDIHRRFGHVKLKTFPMCGMLKYRIYYPYVRGMKRVAPLDYIVYDKAAAEKELHERFGWERYENKHYENVFTRFFEGYYQPHKFGYDKRRCYLSNLILAGQMTREEALNELAKSPYDEKQMQEDLCYIAKKLGISPEEFRQIIDGDNKTYRDYKNRFWFLSRCVDFARLVGVETRHFR